MKNAEKLRTIHQKKLGILLQNARNSKKRTAEECAEFLHISPNKFLEFETGLQSPSFPQIEQLAYFLGIPTEHFWSNRLIDESDTLLPESQYALITKIRNRILAIQIRTRREEKQLTPETMAEYLEIPLSEYQQLEDGELSISLALLEQIAFHLEMNLNHFNSSQGKLGLWNKDRTNSEAVRNLPPDVLNFIINPSNEPYLRLAMHLSGMSADKLRSIAEGLLEITF